MAWYNKDEHEGLEYEEDKGDSYSNSQLEYLADQMLRQYAKHELCRTCLADEKGEIEGQETGKVEHIPQYKDGEPIVDDEGSQLILAYPELSCENGHVWFLSEGKARGHNSENPVLFEEHLIQRKRREIYTTEGVPDPNIVSGIYNRSHPQGRKINTNKQRREHGASYYR